MDQAATAPPDVRCSAGNIAARCCVGDPWEGITGARVMASGEPLDPAVIEVAADYSMDPHALDRHVTANHGWESHDVGYDRAVADAAQCVAGGGCE